MNRIDRFIGVLFEHCADTLQVATGAEAAIAVSGKRKNLTRAPLGEKLVGEMLREIAPDEIAADLDQDGEHAFPYTSPHGDVTVRVRCTGGIFSMEVTAGRSVEAPTQAPAVAPDEPAAPAPEASPPPAAPVAATPEPAAQAPAPTAAAASAAPVAAAPAPGGNGDTAAIDALFRAMVERGSSDLHLTTGCAPLVRLDGGITALAGDQPLAADALWSMIQSIAPPERLEEFHTCNDTDFAYELGGVGRFRCNVFRDRTGVGAVFRVIPTEIITSEQLGLSQHILDLCALSKGLVIVTGPTGSGKSTTLAAMVDHINKTRDDHVITIEDPIEFVHRNQRCLVNQREIGTHTDGFKPALRAALREDPDIVLIGEMRDLETIEIAIETAETGHLVFGTLHTNTAASTVDRVIDQFPTDRQSQIRTMLASSLRGVVAQTLCKKNGGGRVAALEVLLINQAIANLIREGKTFQIPSIMQTNRQHGMVTLSDALLELVQAGTVEPDEAYKKAADPGELGRLFQAKGIQLSEPLQDEPAG